MAADPVRATALEILDRLEAEGLTLDHYLQSLAQPAQFNRQRDRNLIYALTYGVARWRERLDWIIGRFSRIPLPKLEPSVRNALRMALFQIFFLQRVPPSAAVNTAVDLIRRRVGPRATGFVNAVLRNALRQKADIALPDEKADPVLALSVRHSHPQWMVRRWVEQYGTEGAGRILAANNHIAPLTVKVNTTKTSREECLRELQKRGFEARSVRFSPWGVEIGGRDARVLASKAFDQGWFQVQDEAAQLATMILAPKAGQAVLDACAGRGGKTFHIAQMMQGRGKLVAADHAAQKLAELEKEARRLGLAGIETLVHDLEAPAGGLTRGTFDGLMLDAPCSGMGVLRRHPEAKWRLSPADIERHARRQSRLLDQAAQLVKSGGCIVYVVCTTTAEETTEVVNRFLKRNAGFEVEALEPYLPAAAHHMVDGGGCFRTCTHRDGVDGFFAARLKRLGSVQA